ncbi:uncharacterized protein LOC125646263 [Ostrea edulis]|uniref:uncharacterized protein LOC125646263 n=1 Tax=Ostrea edulis TaxID=37623 RepID=UPI0024AFBDFE|nr:uncharacterized protein LOC125646263 [Ostrea edulis]
MTGQTTRPKFLAQSRQKDIVTSSRDTFTMSKVKFSMDSPYMVLSSQCDCKAGNGHCSHCVGLLYLLCHFQKLGLKAVPPIQSKTSLPQHWNIPQRTEGLAPKQVDNIEVYKVKPKTSQPKRKRKITEGILPNVYCPVKKPIPSNELKDTLIKQLTAIGSDAQILKVFGTDEENCETVPSQFGPVPVGSPLSYQQKISKSDGDLIINNPDQKTFPDCELPNLISEYSTVLNYADFHVSMGLHINHDFAIELEKQTNEQSYNKTWHDVRRNRITSSIFKDICSRKSDFESLATRILQTKHIQTAAMKYGLEHEPEAAKLYSEITMNNVYKCGFVLNPNAPHLGTSPDRKVYDPTSIPQFGLLEIKCPDKDSFVDCKYLVKNKTNGTYKLKSSHSYFYQVMGQMALTGLTWCDFFVNCRQDYHKERIHFDSDKWADMKISLDKFYFEYLLPAICKNCQN